MHYQIFIPGGKEKSDLIEVGLNHLAPSVALKEIVSGPTDGPGLLCSWFTNRDELNQGYRSEFQDWIPAIADGEHFPAERYWVGLEKTSPPTPVDLERRTLYNGGSIDLNDGHRWKIPRADSLPCEMIRDDDGETQFHRDAKYARFCSEAAEWNEVFLGHNVGGKTTYTALRDFVELALQVNYRLVPEVSDALTLFTSGQQGSVLKAALAICRNDATEVKDGG